MTGGQGITVNGSVARRPRGGHLLAWGITGMIAQVAFVAGWVIAETWQGPGYSLANDTISDLQAATAPHAWFPIACFAVGGLGTFGFTVFGLRPAPGRGREGRLVCAVDADRLRAGDRREPRLTGCHVR